MNDATNAFAGRSYSSAGRRELLDAPVMEHRDAVGHRERLRLVVRDVHDGHAELVVQVLDLELHLLAQLLVERAERLVHQHELRPVDERARHRHALLLPAGELRRLAVAQVRQAHHLERAPDPRRDLRFRDAVHLAAETRGSRATVMCGNSA